MLRLDLVEVWFSPAICSLLLSDFIVLALFEDEVGASVVVLIRSVPGLVGRGGKEEGAGGEQMERGGRRRGGGEKEGRGREGRGGGKEGGGREGGEEGGRKY